MTASSTRRDPASNGGWLDRFLTKLSCIWDIFQDLGRVLKYARLSLVVTLLAGFALIFVDQGQELVVIHAEEPWSLLIFYPVVVFWAINAWYWARHVRYTPSYGRGTHPRQTSQIDPKETPRAIDRCRNRNPR